MFDLPLRKFRLRNYCLIIGCSLFGMGNGSKNLAEYNIFLRALDDRQEDSWCLPIEIHCSTINSVLLVIPHAWSARPGRKMCKTVESRFLLHIQPLMLLVYLQGNKKIWHKKHTKINVMMPIQLRIESSTDCGRAIQFLPILKIKFLSIITFFGCASCESSYESPNNSTYNTLDCVHAVCYQRL
jgi:hypothetical protein